VEASVVTSAVSSVASSVGASVAPSVGASVTDLGLASPHSGQNLPELPDPQEQSQVSAAVSLSEGETGLWVQAANAASARQSTKAKIRECFFMVTPFQAAHPETRSKPKKYSHIILHFHEIIKSFL
jgi:hypothetical protein